MMRRFATIALAVGLPVAAPSCVVIHEDYDQPFDIDPPTQLWEEMDESEVDDIGRDWIARCLDNGGKPVVFGIDGFCADRDY